MITIVTGIQRSGKSMMMQMLRAGGMELSYDPKHMPPNEFNENGFFEHKQPFDLLCDPQFRESIDGKAISLVVHRGYELDAIPFLSRKNMRIIWIDRSLEATWHSHLRVNPSLNSQDERDAYETEAAHSIKKLKRGMKTFGKHVRFEYNNIINNPLDIALDLALFLEILDFRVDEAAAAVERRLCHHG